MSRPKKDSSAANASPLETFIDCIKRDDYETALRLIDDEEVDLNKHDKNGLAPIHYLALCNVNPMLFMAICKNTNNNLMPIADGFTTSSCESGDTVLHIAAAGRDINGNPNDTLRRNFCNAFGHIEIGSVDIFNKHGQTPLMTAIAHSNIPMVDFLLARGASIDILDQDDDNLLELAENALDGGGRDATTIHKKIAGMFEAHAKVAEEEKHKDDDKEAASKPASAVEKFRSASSLGSTSNLGKRERR